MRGSWQWAAVGLTALVASLGFVGCNPANKPPVADEHHEDEGEHGHGDHAHHDHDHGPGEDFVLPKTFADAVAAVKKYRDTIAGALGSSDLEKTHTPLDEVDVVLSKLGTIARDSGVPVELLPNVDTAAKALQTLFKQLHEDIDAGKTPQYAAISPGIDAALKGLDAVLAGVGALKAPALPTGTVPAIPVPTGVGIPTIPVPTLAPPAIPAAPTGAK